MLFQSRPLCRPVINPLETEASESGAREFDGFSGIFAPESPIVLDGLNGVSEYLLHRGDPAINTTRVTGVRIWIGGGRPFMNIVGRRIDPPQKAAPRPKRQKYELGRIRRGRGEKVHRRGVGDIEFIADFEDHRWCSAIEGSPDYIADQLPCIRFIAV